MNTCLSDKALIERTEIVSEHITEGDSEAQRSMNTCLRALLPTSMPTHGEASGPRTRTSSVPFVSPATRLVAHDWKATYRPSPLIVTS